MERVSSFPFPSITLAPKEQQDRQSKATIHNPNVLIVRFILNLFFTLLDEWNGKDVTSCGQKSSLGVIFFERFICQMSNVKRQIEAMVLCTDT